MSTVNNDDSVADQEQEQPEDGEGTQIPFSRPLSFFARFLLPVALVLLSANYVRVTWGQIRTANLQYPYFVIGTMCLLILWVAIEEVRSVYEMDPEITSRQAIADFLNYWRTSILFAVIAVVYVWLIPVTGFFSASFIALVTSMYVADARNYTISTAVIVGVLALVWVMFVEILGVNPPSGLIDGLIL